jgi:hypothetical protein
MDGNSWKNGLIPSQILVWRNTNVKIQQDNCRVHIALGNPAFLEAAKSDGWNIQLVNQPANSPDLNVLGLGFSVPSKPCKCK